MSDTVHISKGPDGVVADATSVSHVDGAGGRLYYRGYPIEALTRHRFAEVIHLILFGELPNAARLEEVEEYLWTAGRLPPEVAASIRELARYGEHPMATLQAIAPLLATDPPPVSLGRTSHEEEGLVVAARLPAAIALIRAALQDHPAPAYPASRRYGERYLQLLHGRRPSPEHVATFEAIQILQLDHGFNASTFTARVVTSTLASAPAALSAALGALSGLHGAADQHALEMALEAGDPQRAEAYVAQCVASGRVMMGGTGQRDYRGVDPRARIGKTLAQRVATLGEHVRLLDTLSAIEEAFIAQTPDKSRLVRADLEFYKGVVYLALDIQKELFTATFAAARAFGWVAHIVEQRHDNRIIRPSARYIGPPPREDVTPGAELVS